MNPSGVTDNADGVLQDTAGMGTVRGGRSPTVELDAAMPRLHAEEARRLNRRALLFLAGILLMLLAMAALVVHGRGTAGKPPAPPKRAERVSLPELPAVASAAQVAEPTQRPQAEPELPALPVPLRAQDSAPSMQAAQAPQPSLLQRRMQGRGDFVAGAGMPLGGSDEAMPPMDAYTRAMLAQLQGTAADPADATASAAAATATRASHLRHPDTLLLRGTYLRCVLETRIVSEVAGHASCLLSEPVYSLNGSRLLLPKGSKIQGSHGAGASGQRLEVLWDRIITPDGLDISMSSPGVDPLGGAGHPGHYNAHWGSRIGSVLMISVLADAFKYAAAEHGPESTTLIGPGMAVRSPWESATARSIERLAGDALRQQRPATVSLAQGSVVNVYVARDIDFSNVLPASR